MISALRYTPYGAPRDGSLPTDRRYTGQREEAGIGLYDYNARFYDPALGRFISPDSIVPEPGNAQAFNRYSYTLNNPVKYADPSGHMQQPAQHDYNDDIHMNIALYAIRNINNYVGGELGLGHTNDCTNFSSYALRYGGLKENELWHSPEWSSSNHPSGDDTPAWNWTGWDRSKIEGDPNGYPASWGLYPYLTEPRENGGQGFSAIDLPANIDKYHADTRWIEYLNADVMGGDVAFYYQDENDLFYGHSAVVVGWGPANATPEQINAFMAEHNGGFLIERPQNNESLVPYVIEHSGAEGNYNPRPIYWTEGSIIELRVVKIYH